MTAGQFWQTLKFEDGKFYIIAGALGSGRATLLNILTCIDRPTDGRVIVDGTDITAMGEKGLRRYRLENFGIIFQFFYLVPYLTGLENVMLPMKYSRKIENPGGGRLTGLTSLKRGGANGASGGFSFIFWFWAVGKILTP
ncbi:ATP-binding cassette domain-containing protein [Thermococcus sp.]|uniref:ATP-binding cassette domain-containing protein n=1 Tax=Thermococcus sp. TaxID=35749 RepID=UPI0026299F69|nr:ATP-binding cassette domain-containing protein [Thermococcus sp.]